MSLYFAWIEKGEIFDPQRHAREDNPVFRLEIRQKEGGFALAYVTLPNPKEGLLKKERKTHCLISYDDGNTTHLLFRGRLLGMPAHIEGEGATLDFTAEPEDARAQQSALVQSMKISPYWDDLFVDESSREDPMEALDARSDLYYWDRTTGQIRLSSIFEGSEMFDLGETFFRESLQVEVNAPPLASVDVELVAEWTQRYTSLFNLQWYLFGGIQTLTGQDLSVKWWREGEEIGKTGYWVSRSELKEPFAPTYSPYYWTLPQTSEDEIPHPHQVQFREYDYRPKLILGWSYQQARRETLKFTLKQATQNLSHAQSRSRTLRIVLQDVVGMDQNSQSQRPTFFITDRGHRAFAHALEIAKAHLASSARAITVRFRGRFEDLHALTTDHQVSVRDDRLPGGVATGKVTGYRLMVDGNTGIRWVEVTIGVAIGQATEEEGALAKEKQCPYLEEAYCDLDYVEDPTPLRSKCGVSYRFWGDQMPREGLLYLKDLNHWDFVESVKVTHDAKAQKDILQEQQYPKTTDIRSVLKKHPTNVRIELKDLQGSGILTHTIHVNILTPWTAPKQIDLAG